MRRRACLLASMLALAALAAVPSTALADDCAGADLQPADGNIAQVSQATLCLLNQQRAAAGLAPLSEQAQLDQASTAYSALMVKEGFFAHVAPDGSQLTDRLTAVGYLGQPGSWFVGENIAWGESYLATPAQIVNAWMNSEGHRANILSSDYRDIGIGIALGVPTSSNPGATYTTDFGSRSSDPANPTAAPASTPSDTVSVGPAPTAPTTTGSRTDSKSATGSNPAASKPAASKPARRRRSCHAAMAGWGTRAAAHRSTCILHAKHHGKRR